MHQEKTNDQDMRLKENMARIKNKILVMSGKGGVGKTTVAVNLAYGLAMEGFNVGLMDVDIHGPNIAKMLGIETEQISACENEIEPVSVFPNFKVISLALLGYNVDQPFIWRGPKKGGVIKQFLAETHWGELDYLIIDSPPGTGDEPLSICQLIENLDAAVIVTTPQDVAVLDSRKSIVFAQQLKVPFIGLIENMSGFVCPECNKTVDIFGSGNTQKTAHELEVAFLGRIPLESVVVTAGDAGKPVIQFNRDSETAKSMHSILESLTTKFKIEETI